MAVSKRLRYEVFARDGFTCRYCGGQPPDVKLHADHLIPRSKGGDDSELNLVTSCAACNLGKAARTPAQSAPTEEDRLRMAQQSREQIDLAKLLKHAAKARASSRDTLLNVTCDVFGWTALNRGCLSRLVNLAEEFGQDDVLEWIDCACSAGVRDANSLSRYVSGCARNERES